MNESEIKKEELLIFLDNTIDKAYKAGKKKKNEQLETASYLLGIETKY